MTTQRIEVSLLFCLEALLAEKSVTRAANRLGMSQPGMSNALSRLRKLFGDELFRRTSRGMEPTAAGVRVALDIEHLHSDTLQAAVLLSKLTVFPEELAARERVVDPIQVAGEKVSAVAWAADDDVLAAAGSCFMPRHVRPGDHFAALLSFLEGQGKVQVLSSPRIATLNNQKAVLKVGTDDYFVTNVSGGTTNSGTTSSTGNSTTLPTLALTPFFSGISLDVTPQIDDGNNVMLHVHPAVTSVVEKTRQVDLGSIGNYRLPLASSSVNETDTLVRIQDGNIVAIGGLMQLEASRTSSGVPGTSGLPAFSSLFGNRANSGRKKEVVVLIKPTIIRTLQDWESQTRRTRLALDDMDAARARVIRIDGSVDDSKPKSPVK